MINDDIAARIAAKAARDTERKCPGRRDCPCLCHEGLGDVEHRNRKCDGGWADDLPWLQPATVDPDWLTEARNHSAATREPFTHPLWDVSAA